MPADADADPRPPAPVDVARIVADAARAHDDVVDLDAGLAGEFATYGLGGRVPGVRVERDRDGRTKVQVRLVVRFGRALPDIGDEVRSRVTARLDAAEPEVHVHIADIVSEAAELDHPGAP
ncbi:MAG TPA: Asp23/Gls24 family envelope stress response protein [Acidimicrobiales bacterium]|nr:Asp23/Gls24 family envelope stress response protein [Acidimicrobiales bacterium]